MINRELISCLRLELPVWPRPRHEFSETTSWFLLTVRCDPSSLTKIGKEELHLPSESSPPHALLFDQLLNIILEHSLKRASLQSWHELVQHRHLGDVQIIVFSYLAFSRLPAPSASKRTRKGTAHPRYRVISVPISPAPYIVPSPNYDVTCLVRYFSDNCINIAIDIGS